MTEGGRARAVQPRQVGCFAVRATSWCRRCWLSLAGKEDIVQAGTWSRSGGASMAENVSSQSGRRNVDLFSGVGAGSEEV